MKVYALRIKDKHDLLNSSSGGAFTAISNLFIENGEAVVSTIYNYETNQNEFKLYTDYESRDKARGSKYMQAYPMNAYKDAEIWIKKHNKNLLFVGTGCQAEAFRLYSEVRGFRDKTVIVGIVCHGVPSPMIWKDFVNGKIEYVSFKDKRNGWLNPYAYVIKNGKEEDIAAYDKLFYNKCILRPSCYVCPFATLQRNVDITIGDFWGIDRKIPDFYSFEGNSLVLVHSKKGQDIFERIKENVEWVESNEVDCQQPNLMHPTKKSSRREQFWKTYNKHGLRKTMKVFVNVPLWRRVIRKFLRLSYKITGREWYDY